MPIQNHTSLQHPITTINNSNNDDFRLIHIKIYPTIYRLERTVGKFEDVIEMKERGTNHWDVEARERAEI
jgi:hypothetical protein